MYMDIDDEVPSKHLATSRRILSTSNCFEKMAEEEPPPPQPPQQEHAAEALHEQIREPNRVIQIHFFPTSKNILVRNI